MSPFMFDGDGEPIDARDVLNPDELAEHQRIRGERIRAAASGRRRREQLRQAAARRRRDQDEDS